MPHRLSSTKFFIAAGALIVLVLAAAAPAAALLQLGDTAPPLDVAQWIQGPPVPTDTPWAAAVHVVEFWSPDCPHCRDSIPVLNMIQEAHGGKVVVLGVTDAAPQEVKAFLSKAEEPVGYGIAVDAEGQTNAAFMDGFGIDGVPHAFVVDRSGRIVWEGHPMDGLDLALDQIVSGTYDLAGQIRRETAKKLIPVYLYLAERTRETALCRQVGERIFTLAANDASMLLKLAQSIIDKDTMVTPDLELALRATRRAMALESGKNPEMVKTRDELLRRTYRRQDKRHEENSSKN